MPIGALQAEAQRHRRMVLFDPMLNRGSSAKPSAEDENKG